MTNLAEKLKEFREMADLSQREMAKELGIASTSYQYYEGDYKKPYMPQQFHDKIIKIAEFCMIESRYVRDIIGSNRQITLLEDNIINVPVFEFHAGAGGGGIVDNETPLYHMPKSTHYLQRIGLGDADLMAIEVRGDSMVETLQSGDQIMIDRRDTNPAGEGIFCIHDGDGLVVKRIEKVRPLSNPVKLRLISDNTHHSSYDVPIDQIRIIGRVVWFGRRL